MATWWTASSSLRGDQLSGLTLKTWHCILKSRRCHATRFQSLGEDPKAIVLCGTVCRQLHMTAVTVAIKKSQMCHLAAIAISGNGVCRLDFLQHLVVGGGCPWDGSLEPVAAQQCHILS